MVVILFVSLFKCLYDHDAWLQIDVFCGNGVEGW